MDYTLIAPVCLAGFLILLMLGIPVIYSLGFASVVVAFLAFGGPSLEKVGWTTFSTLYNFNWTPLPLFVIWACIIAETKIGDELYDAARNWLSNVPGGLIVASIFGEAALSAAIGTSGACIVAMGKVAEPEFKKYGYDKAFSFGGILAAGILGPLIPPGVGFIVYGVLAEVSIGHLLIAGIVPGIICAIMLSAPAIIMCARNPKLGPPIGHVSWSKRVSSLKKTWSIILVMIAMLGAIYLGIATPTEAAGVGVVVTLIIAVAFYGLRLKGMRRALEETAVLNGMVLFIMVGAWLFSYVIGSSGIADNLVDLIASSGLSRWWVIIAINILLLILGCFIDPITIMLLTVPLFAPIVSHLGFDLVWFGVLYVVNMQIGLITPPVGLDLFFVRSTFNIPMHELIRGTMPYLIVLIIFLFILIAFPQLSLWLPNMMMGK